MDEENKVQILLEFLFGEVPQGSPHRSGDKLGINYGYTRDKVWGAAGLSLGTLAA